MNVDRVCWDFEFSFSAVYSNGSFLVICISSRGINSLHDA